ncbi:MAG: SirB2 family protein [Proteobacteria bacterium]|nr:SirB2 family protein [Pseudomonadota bacterium]MBS0225671.1 SirB2 family protein [Pseudomonadota bacterium]
MIEFYPQIKAIHVFLALLSGSVFAIRGACVIAGARWPLSWPVKGLSYTIDTALLSAALMLVGILPGAMFANGWLAVKIALIFVYIMLGVFALRTARTRGARVALYMAALVTYACIYATARAHNPLGAIRWWFG